MCDADADAEFLRNFNFLRMEFIFQLGISFMSLCE